MYKKIFYLKLLLVVTDVVMCNPDYHYNKTAGGWLKLHPIVATWQEAFQKCHNEGTVLASPLNFNLANALYYMMVTSGVGSRIHLGIYSSFNDKNYVTVEGTPLDMIPIKWHVEQWTDEGDCLAMYLTGAGESSYYIRPSSCSYRLPYICYKKREHEVTINECGNFDTKYHLNQQTGSCYKLHDNAKPWSKAYEICIDEGGHLTIINDQTEAELIKGMFPNKTESPFPALSRELMHIGLRRWSMGLTWFTIHGEDIASVNNWATGKPNNVKNQTCGLISREGTIEINSCDYPAIFVCEKDPSTTHFEKVTTPVPTTTTTSQPRWEK